MYRHILLFLTILLPMADIYALSIPAGAALERALLSERPLSGSMRRSQAIQPDYSLAYSAPSGSYHVFNRSTDGYIVVSGDDEIYPVLADITSGRFSPENMAPAAKWMLDRYDSQIQAFSDGGDDSQSEQLTDYYNKWTEIAPLMTTQWNQSAPYNKYCPVVDGRTCVTGCVATAMAQVVRCIGYYKGSGRRSTDGINANGEKVEFDYASAEFDFDSMFDTYPSPASQESIDQVGQLMLACGLAVGMGYTPSASAAPSQNVVRGLVNHFGFDSNYTQIYYCDDFGQAQWENMLYSQLQTGRPVYYAGSGGTGGHAFVIDGYRPAGMYHVNWGWGGISDGYFRLTALDPSQIGIGGSTGGYNVQQTMVCAVPPGADPGVTYGDMSGSIRMVADGTYALYYRASGKNLFNSEIGAVIADTSGNGVATATFWRGQNITANSALRHDSFSYDFSQHPLSAGDYRIYPAFRPDGGEYTVTDKIDGRQHYVNLTVTSDGVYTISNSQAPPTEADVHISGIASGYDIRKGFSSIMGFYVVNNGGTDYNGTFRVMLLDETGEELGSATSQYVSVAAGANAMAISQVPVFDNSGSVIRAGVYPLRFADADGNLLSDGEFTLEIKSGYPLSEWTSDENIEVTNSASIPSTLLGGDLWPHTPLIKTLQTHRSMTLMLAFYSPSGVSAVKVLTCFHGTIEPMQSLFTFDPIATDVPFGTYEVCYRKGYNQISQRIPIRIGASVGHIDYLPAGGDGVSVTLMRDDNRDPEEAVIPAVVRIEGTERPVTEIEQEAFLMAGSLSVVDLPSSIRHIGINAFTGCMSLRQIIFRSDMPPFTFRNHIAPGLQASTEFYVPAASYDEYLPRLEAYNPVYALVESIESKEKTVSEPTTSVSLNVYPAHEAVNPAFVITSDDNASEIAEVSVASVEPGKLNLEIKALQMGTATFYIHPAHRSDNYAVLTVTVPETTVIDSLPAGGDTGSETVYDLMGRPVGANATGGSPQLRIVVGADGKASKIFR